MTSQTSCKSQDEGKNQIQGTYSNESTNLELLNNGTFILVLNSGLITVKGDYNLENELITLIEKESSSKSYRLRNLKKIKEGDLRIRILTENGRIGSGMFCELDSEGIVFESYADDDGIWLFKDFKHGTILFSRLGHQSVEIDTKELESNSIEVTMIQERFKENIEEYVFVFKGDKLVGKTLKGEELSKK